MSKNVELVLNSGRIDSFTVDGKKAKASHMRGLRKAQETSYWTLYDSPKIGANPFTGFQVELTAFEASIYNWCVQWYRLYRSAQTDVPIQTYDDMKYILLDINPQAYMDLLD